MTHKGSALSAWALAGTGVVAAMMLVLLEDLGSKQLYTLTLHLPGIDKVLHFTQSFVICYVLGWLVARTGMPAIRRVALAAAGALVAAGFDEVQQMFQPDRSIEFGDIGAGAAGILMASAGQLRATAPRVAAAAMTIAIAAAGAITYGSYQYMSDYNHGVLAEQAGNRAEALGHYLRGADAGTSNPEIYNAAAWLIVQSPDGDMQRAVALAERSLQLRPGNPDALDTYGWSLYRAGRTADALAPLKRAFAAKPDIYCIHYHLGMVYLGLDRRDEAIRHLQQQVDLMPNTIEANLAAATLARLHQSARG